MFIYVFIYLHEKMIDYNETFQLMLATRNPTPDIPPDVRTLQNCQPRSLLNYRVNPR